MITALVHSLGAISFPRMWQYPDLAVQGVCAEKVLEASITTSRSLVSFMFMAERWQGQMTWVEKRVAGCCVGLRMETEPKGCCRTPRMPAEHKTWLLAHVLSITKAKSRPLTGCDLDRWMARHMLFVAEKVRQQCEILPLALKSEPKPQPPPSAAWLKVWAPKTGCRQHYWKKNNLHHNQKAMITFFFISHHLEKLENAEQSQHLGVNKPGHAVLRAFKCGI